MLGNIETDHRIRYPFAPTELFLHPCDQDVLILNPKGHNRMVSIGEFRPTAAAICISRYGPKSGGKKEFLLIQRGTDPSYGDWSLPGGRFENEDLASFIFSPNFRDVLAFTAQREARQETGLSPNKVGGIMLGFHYPEQGHRVLVFETFLSPDEPQWSTEPKPGEGILAARWVLETEIPNLPLTPMAKEVLLHFSI